MGSQRVGYHWATELNWTEENPRTLVFPLPFIITWNMKCDFLKNVFLLISSVFTVPINKYQFSFMCICVHMCVCVCICMCFWYKINVLWFWSNILCLLWAYFGFELENHITVKSAFSFAAALIRGNRKNCAQFSGSLDWLISRLERLEASSGMFSNISF